MDDFRRELDELFGKDRNLPRSQQRVNREHFSDNDVWKHFLVALCPNELFINTKSDMGRCKKRHESYLRSMLAQDPNKLWYQKKYESELLDVLNELVAGVDTRIRRSLARIEATVPDLEKKQANQDKVNSINALIDRKLQEVEALAEAGHINESEALIKEIEALKEAREEQEAMVCEICGAMQSTTDTERRQESHLKGKQHIGFSTIRECIKQLKAHQEMYQHVDITRPPDVPAEPKLQPFRQYQKKEDPRKKQDKRGNHSRSPRY